jgi:predicted enzyme related to lactoylglutathione lyase
MVTQLSYVTVIVRDYDEALNWYENRLGLEKRMDIKNGDIRWLTVGVQGQKSPEIILQKPTVSEYDKSTQELKLSQIGKNPTWILAVDDCRTTVAELRSRGVDIVEEPKESPWGISALIRDLYGNLFSLNQQRSRNP